MMKNYEKTVEGNMKENIKIKGKNKHENMKSVKTILNVSKLYRVLGSLSAN